MCGCLSCAPTGDLAHIPGMCLDWESNQWPFVSKAGTQSTEPHQPWPSSLLKTIEDSKFRRIIPDIPLGERWKGKEDLVYKMHFAFSTC